jgi:flagella basal body P-ring formation protein FlgA
VNNNLKKIFIISITSLMMTSLVSINLYSKSTFSGERLKQACLNYIYSMVGNDAEVSISDKIEDQNFDESGIVANCFGEEKSLKGNCYIIIEFHQNGFLKRRLQIPVRVRLFNEVATAVKTIFRGEAVKAENISLEKKEVTNYTDIDLMPVDEIIGKKARNNISEGSIITRLSLESEKTINRGDKVKIVVEAGAIRISATGEALQDGAIGDMILVKREGTQVKLKGRVSLDGSVIIAQ